LALNSASLKHLSSTLAGVPPEHPTCDYLERAHRVVVRCLRLLNLAYERKARRRLAALTVAVTAALAVLGGSTYLACNVYDSSLLLPEAGPGPEASTDPNACQHVSPPSRPDSGDDGDAGLVITAAFRTIDIGLDPDASTPFGYDLDNVCTCPGPPSCTQPANVPISCDDDAGGNTGRDNTSIQLFRGIGAASTAGTQQIDDALNAGQYGLLLTIQNYNGLANDPRVTVSYYVSNGLNRGNDGGIPAPPTFMGTDKWTIDPTSLAQQPPNGTTISDCSSLPAQCTSVFTTDQAYVTNYTVVAHFTNLTVTFGDRSFLGGATMLLNDAILVGQLQQVQLVSHLFSYNLVAGTIAGRWPTQALLSTLATIPDPNVDGGFLCGQSNFEYQLIKTVVCDTADISSQAITDNSNAPCDAVSVGMTFTAGPAMLGGVLSVPAAPAGCGDAGLTFTDNCQ
jgi:hypothetical protein